MLTLRRTLRFGVVVFLTLLSVTFLLAGCSHEEIPTSPNEKTAAPARMPGVDPHAHTGTPKGVKK